MKNLDEAINEAQENVKLISKAEFFKAFAKVTDDLMNDEAVGKSESVTILIMSTLFATKVAKEFFDEREGE